MGLGPRWVRVTTVAHGHRRSPAVAKGSEEQHVAEGPAHAAGMMQMGDSDCGPEGRSRVLGHPAPLLRAWNVARGASTARHQLRLPSQVKRQVPGDSSSPTSRRRRGSAGRRSQISSPTSLGSSLAGRCCSKTARVSPRPVAAGASTPWSPSW
jgi:hypothetical protein